MMDSSNSSEYDIKVENQADNLQKSQQKALEIVETNPDKQKQTPMFSRNISKKPDRKAKFLSPLRTSDFF